MERKVTAPTKPIDLYLILEGAAGLVVMAGRIETAMLEQIGKPLVQIPRKELLAVAKINRLNAQIVDEMVYRVEQRDEHIKTLEQMIKILKARD